MKKTILLISLVFITISCNSKKEKKETPVKEKVEVKKNINDFLIFNNTLTKQDIETAEYKNITFQKEGAVFTRDAKKPTYIKIPFTNLDFKQGFNVSFTFNTSFDDGRKPQSLITFANKYTSGSRSPLYIYTPGNKISGVYGTQLLWADGYKKENGRSKAYFNSFKIKKDKDYFVSVNYDGKSTLEIYLNSELYAKFEDLKPHDLKSQFLVIGAILRGEKVSGRFEGTIYGVKIFNTSLTESEIAKLFNTQPSFFEY